MTALQKTLGLLALALATAVLLQQVLQEDDAPPALLPDLEAQLEEVTKVVISASATTTLVREPTGWVIEEKGGYPLDFSKLSSLLRGLAEAERVESKTAKPELQAQLGLATEGAGASRAKAISIYTASDASAPAYTLLIGKASQGRKGAYIKQPRDPRAWLVNRDITTTDSPDDWLDKVIINVDAMDVQKVELGLQTDSPLVAVRGEGEGDGMVIEGLPEDAALRYPSIADNLARALVNLRFQQVAPYDEAAWAEAAEARFTLRGGETITVLTREDEGQYHLHLSIEAAPPSSLAAQATKSAWQYEISSYAFEQLTKTLADMLEEPDSEAGQ